MAEITAALVKELRERTGAGNSDDPFKLANFLKKGGKVILYHGGSDSLITPFRSTWYYEQLANVFQHMLPGQLSDELADIARALAE